MIFSIHSKNLELTKPIKGYAEEKIGSVLRLLSGGKSDIPVQIRMEVGKPSRHHKSGKVFYAEVNLKIGSKLIRSSEEDYDLYVAIDKVRDRLEAQIRKFKEKRISVHSRETEK
jgi:ribosomal subunit interface protein